MSDNFDMNDQDVQMPLGIGRGNEGESHEIPFGEEKKPKINAATMVLIGIFTAGLAGIYLVGMQNKPRGVSAEQINREARVDSAIAELLAQKGGSPGASISSLYKDSEKLVAMFYNYPGGDAGSGNLDSNPFALSTVRENSAEPIVRAVVGNAAEQERLRHVAENFATLHLDSVVLSANMKAAMINRKLVTVGAKVGEFTVLTIENQRVILGFENSKFELKLQRKGMEPTP